MGVNQVTAPTAISPYRFYFKDLDSRFIAVSRAVAEDHGRKDPKEMIGLTDRDLFSSEHAEGALADELEIIRTGKPIIDYEEKETWPDREDTWASTTKMPWRDTQGNIIGTFGISQDITEKKRAAELAAMRVWGKYAPVNLVRRLYREKSEPVLGGELMEISIMFSDIKGFTTLSEQLDPNRLAEMLGLYLDTLSCIIQRDTQGTIDKYIGDAIMTIWNAPEPVPDPPKWRASPRYAAATRRDLSRKHPNGANFLPLRHASDCIVLRLWLGISARATG
jgi:PAS domain S-box-containing protein